MLIKLNDKLDRVYNVEVKSVDKENFTLEAIFSVAKEDRHGDVVMQDGWDLKNFKKNPVILNSHNYGDATEVIGKATNVKVVNGKLEGKIIFAVNENPKAKIIFDLYAGGFLNAFSVGFIVKEFATNEKGITDYSVITKAELLEVSAVSVPANAYALAKSKGIDVDILGEDIEVAEDEDEKDEEVIVEDVVEDEEELKDDPDVGDVDFDTDDDKEKSCDECEANRLEKLEAEKNKVKLTEAYPKKVARIINTMNNKHVSYLKRANDIIKSLLDGDLDGKKIEEKTKQQIRQRKVNQAIRELLKTK